MQREAILLTPGPLTTTLRTKLAMLRDWGSWDSDFIAVTARVRKSLLNVIQGQETHVVVPLQGSGTFSVEAAVATVVPPSGHILVLDNGAYCKRAAKISTMMGRKTTVVPTAEDKAVSPTELDTLLNKDPSITHVVLIHCETGAGVLNPLHAVAQVCEKHNKGLIVDAMSSFAAIEIDARTTRFDALIAASGKCLEGVPGMGFVVVKQTTLEAAAGNAHSLALDLHDQWIYMQKTGQWRYTPPTHVVAALRVALDQFHEEGGVSARNARYQKNCDALVAGMRTLGLRTYLADEVQAPIIVTFHSPDHPNFQFSKLYEGVKAQGFILYPGKLTQVETFRVGCIGAIDSSHIFKAVAATERTLRDLGVLV